MYACQNLKLINIFIMFLNGTIILKCINWYSPSWYTCFHVYCFSFLSPQNIINCLCSWCLIRITQVFTISLLIIPSRISYFPAGSFHPAWNRFFKFLFSENLLEVNVLPLFYFFTSYFETVSTLFWNNFLFTEEVQK